MLPIGTSTERLHCLRCHLHLPSAFVQAGTAAANTSLRSENAFESATNSVQLSDPFVQGARNGWDCMPWVQRATKQNSIISSNRMKQHSHLDRCVYAAHSQQGQTWMAFDNVDDRSVAFVYAVNISTLLIPQKEVPVI